MAATRPVRMQKMMDDSDRAKAAAAKALSGVKLDDARRQMILKNVEWADQEFASKIASRAAMVELAKDRIGVTMRGQDLTQQRAAHAEYQKALASLRSPVEKQVEKLQAEQSKLNSELAKNLMDEDDDAAEQTKRLLVINAARQNAAARKLYEINQQAAQAPVTPAGPTNPMPPFGQGNMVGPIGGARGTAPVERKPAKKKPGKKIGGTTRSGASWDYQEGG